MKKEELTGGNGERSRLGTKRDGTVRSLFGGGGRGELEGRKEGWGTSLYVLVVSEKAEGGMRF